MHLRELRESQTAIARLLDVTQPTVQKLLKCAEHNTMPVEGFSGANPFEICERYVAGYLTREQLIKELSCWNYAPARKRRSCLTT